MTTIALTEANFEQVIDNNAIVFVDFWAQWCGPCLSFAPIYERVAKEFPEIIFAKVDIEHETEISSAFQIRSIPLLMVFKERIVVFSQSGVLPEPALRDLVQQAKVVDISAVKAEIAKQEEHE